MSSEPFDYWAFFAGDARRTGSPLYGRLAEAIGTDAELKTMAARARPGQPHANLILGAVHYLLLRGAEHPLKRFYATAGGHAPEGEDPFPAFRDFVFAHRAEVLALIETRVTNTNEVGRSSLLHPGFRVLAAEAKAPLHLIEIGPSAGLNLIWDKYGMRYLRDGAPVFVINPDSALVIDCELRGDGRPPVGPSPAVARRLGLELNPVDLARAEDRDWLRALIWPDQVSRLARLDRAIGLFRKESPEIRAGDALALLPSALAEADPAHAVCVYHTIVRYQFSREMREALENMLIVAGLRRPVWELSFDFHSGEYLVRLTCHRDGTREERVLANSHPHGTWLEWRA
jgi:hypothetical protein